MQTSYSDDPAIGYPGQPADSGYKDDVSRIVDETDGIAPGLVVVRGTDPDTQASLPGSGSTAADVVGVSIRTHHARGTFGSTDTDVYDDGTSLPVRRIGRVYVTVEDAFTPDDDVFFRIAAGAGGSTLGAVRTDADTASAVAWTSAKFVNSGSAGGIGILQILQG